MMKKQHGFTLIELMIVIVIIGILAAIALPWYRDYVIRARIGEGLSLSPEAQTAVAETFQANSAFPTSGTNASYGLPQSSSIAGTYVAGVTVANNTGLVKIAYNSEVAGPPSSGWILTMTAVTSPHGGLAWVCGNAAETIYGKSVGGPGATSTNIPVKYLPQNCR